MNLLPGPGVGDGSNYHIAECYHTNPITLVLPGNTAKSFYKEKCFYIIKNEDHRSGGATSPTVYWELDDDNVWRVSDFDSPRDKNIILTKPPLTAMSGVVRYHLIINGKTEEEKDEVQPYPWMVSIYKGEGRFLKQKGSSMKVAIEQKRMKLLY